MHKAAYNNFRIVLGVAAFGALALLPFTLLHLSHGNWYLACVTGIPNLFMVAAVLWLCRYRDNTLVVRATGYMVMALSNTAVLLSILSQGGQAAYWIYPIIFANFYLLPFAAGTVISLVFASLSLLAASASIPAEYLARLLVTTPMCIFLGVIFSLGLSRQRKQLQYMASHDALTGVGNRHSLDLGLTDAVERRARYGERCSLVMLDIDEFKSINDSMGHMHADGIIAELAQLVSDRVRAVDRLYRFGGEEFVLTLPHATGRSSWQLAEALRLEVEEHRFSRNTRITVSAGVAELAEGETAEDWLRRADDAMLRAKASGRNCVIAAQVECPEAGRQSAGIHPAAHTDTAGRSRPGVSDGGPPAPYLKEAI